MIDVVYYCRFHGLSFRELASRCGVSPGTIKKLANGQPITKRIAARVAKYFGCTINEIPVGSANRRAPVDNGHPLKRWRIENRVSLEDAARLLEISKPAICAIENRGVCPRRETLLKIHKVTGIDIETLKKASMVMW